MGDLSEFIASATAAGDLGLTIDSIIQFLGSVNIADSAGCKVKNWDIIDLSDLENMKYVNNGMPFIVPKFKIPEETNGIEIDPDDTTFLENI